MADRKKRTGKWKLFLYLAAGSFLTGCGKAEPELVSTARTPYEKLAYDTTEVKKGNLTPEITLKLKAEGLEKITYDATNTELKLDKVYVAVGDKVEKGELLVSFRSDSLEAKMTQCQDEIADKQLLVEHYVNLMSCDASLDYNEAIANLKRDIEVAERYVEEAEEKLSR